MAFLVVHVFNKIHIEIKRRTDLPLKPSCDGLVKAVMIGEGENVVDAEHQEEHGAADKEIPSVRSAQYEMFGNNAHKVVQKLSRQRHLTELRKRACLRLFRRLLFSSCSGGGRTSWR